MITDNEIKKALECCKDLKCSECPKKTNLFVTDCDVKLCDEVLDLINRQKAEIEGLKADLVRVCAERDARITMLKFNKSEAYREFCEKAIQTITEFFDYQPHLDKKEDVFAHTFRILKELTRNSHGTCTKSNE